MMPQTREQAARRRAANIAAGLTAKGRPRKPPAGNPRRDHVAEVEEGLALGLDLDGIAADMGVKPTSLATVLRKKGHVSLLRRLGIPDMSTAATRRERRG